MKDIIPELPVDISFDFSLFMNRFAIYLLAHKNPKLCLVALLFMFGYDVGSILNCPNHKSDICKKLKVNKDNFSCLIRSIKNDLDIKHVIKAVDRKRKNIENI
jgi:ABC-type bacteriocin/lantibiotic exporter with double-glycine peptidase domain